MLFIPHKTNISFPLFHRDLMDRFSTLIQDIHYRDLETKFVHLLSNNYEPCRGKVM